MKSFSTKKLCRAGIIAALYVALTFIVLPIASGAIQFRPSEALTLLPLFFPESIPALFVGCLLANVISGCTLADIFLGSLITLVSAILTYYTGKLIKNKILKVFVGGLFPIILNALFLPLIWLIYTQLEYMYIVQVGFLLASEALAIYALGYPLFFAIDKLTIKYPILFGSEKLRKKEPVNTDSNNE